MKFIVVCILLSTIFGSESVFISSNNNNSPCPNYFKYDYWNGGTVGILSIPVPQRSHATQDISLFVTFAVKTILQGYAGRVDTVEDLNLILHRLIQGDNTPIKYRITFPVQNPLPQLSSIEVNGKVICTGTTYGSTESFTTYTLKHWIKPEYVPLSPGGMVVVPDYNKPPPQQQQVQQQFQQKPVTQAMTTSTTTRRPITFATTTKPLPPPPPPPASITDGCGISGAPPIALLVTNGKKTEKNAWPWLIAIFVKTDLGQSFQCGGTLISSTHVLTAAHCISSGKRPIRESRFLIYAGKYKLRHTEAESESRDLAKYIIHPGYSFQNELKNDIAIMILNEALPYTASIRPVCIWPENKSSLSYVINKRGIVVGWGKNGNQILTEEPNMIDMPIVTQEQCLRSHTDFQQFTSNNTFCAGNKDNSGPCVGDSGGGFYISDVSNDGKQRWFIRGVVSLSLKDNEDICDLHQYVVFADVGQHLKWINSVINQ